MKKIILFLAFLFALSACNSHKYFEGKITFHSFSSDSAAHNTSSMSFFHDKDNLVLNTTPAILVTPTRIRVGLEKSGNARVDSTMNGLLIRLDKKDIIFHIKGMTIGITKKAIEAYLNIFNNIEIDKNNRFLKMGTAMIKTKMPEISLKKMNKKKKINGYTARKFVLKGTIRTSKDTLQNKQGKAVIWMTRAIHIHWGMLTNLWHQNPFRLPSQNKISHFIFKEGYFPVKLIAYFQGKKLGGVEIKAAKKKIDSSKMQLPANVKMVSLSKYFSKLMHKKT